MHTKPQISRRQVLGGVLACLTMPDRSAHAAPRILLRSSWQTVNIGDIAHTPGMLALIERYIPDAEVRLWPSKVDNGIEELLMSRFPSLKIERSVDEIKAAFEECDFLLHGSGPSLVARKDVERWVAETGKPYGVYGITFSVQESTATRPASDAAISRTISVLSGARFVFFRDTVSLELARQRGCTCPIMEFGPDGAFATDLRNEDKATAFLRAHDLEDGQFLCCIARLRYTPYWKIKPGVAFDETKHARNEAMKEHDLGPLRKAIVAVVRETPLKVLLCPEDASQMEINRENLFDPLPEHVKPRIVWKPDYWLPDEALSTYVRSAGLFGAEMHSPIMCIGNGIPAIVCRWKEQTSKGLMWRDIGLNDWLFDFDVDADRERLPSAVLAMATNPDAAKAAVAKARAFVEQRQQETMSTVEAHAVS